MEEKPLVLVSASVTGVLGEYDHSFAIAEGNDFVIIYGPNGVGKTKLLEIVNSLTNLKGFSLARMPFSFAKLTYSDGSILSAKRVLISSESADRTAGSSYSIEFSLQRPGLDPQRWSHEDDDFAAFIKKRSRYEQIDDEYWQDRIDGEVIHLTDMISRFEKSPRPRVARPQPEFEAAQSFVQLVPSFLIETQRLLAELNRPGRGERWLGSTWEYTKQRSRINEQADKIRSLLNEAQTTHSRITQQLDRSFPNRVLKAAEDSTYLDADAIRDRYNEQNDFRTRLGQVASVSLDNELSLPKTKLDPWALTLLNQYLEDAKKKLAPFEELLTKIELLEQIVNVRLLNKKLKVTDSEGLIVEHSQTGRPIALNSLSSGEQHEIILMIDLLFNVPPGAVVLIDEPEISLHVAWQIAFIPDVRKIAELAGFRFVVATHSPQIINNEWDQAMRLGPSGAIF